MNRDALALRLVGNVRPFSNAVVAPNFLIPESRPLGLHGVHRLFILKHLVLGDNPRDARWERKYVVPQPVSACRRHGRHRWNNPGIVPV
eukprot:6563494-Lingulodinium_polyedra.AAC.1